MNNRTGICGILGAVLLSLSALGLPSPATESSREGAKDLFYKQQANANTVMNTGVQYWIELKRDGKVTHVSNKFAFKSGDNIRIHVKSNVDAFAYIMLKESSGGSSSVLFPDARFHDNNKLKAAVDYSIPQDYMAFDNEPGTEQVLLVLSRTPVDATAYLADKTKKHAIIAAVPSGSKDLIPGSVVLAYSKQDAAPAVLDQSAPTSNTVLASSSKEDAATTLVQKDPSQVLSVELALLHQP